MIDYANYDELVMVQPVQHIIDYYNGCEKDYDDYCGSVIDYYDYCNGRDDSSDYPENEDLNNAYWRTGIRLTF